MPGTQHSAWLQWRTEDAAVQNTGLGAGKAETQGAAFFLERELSSEVLVYKGKINAIFFNSAHESRVSDMIFTRSLDDHNLDYESVDIGPEVQVRGEEISGPLVSIPAEPNP